MLTHTGCRAAVVIHSHVDAHAGIEREVDSLKHMLVRSGDYESWLAFR